MQKKNVFLQFELVIIYMKKCIYILMLFIGLSNLWAAPVNSNTAMRVAENFWKGITSETSKAEWIQDASFSHLFIFHFNDDEGFVIVSADDSAFPILGYGTDNVAGEMGPETRFWLSQYENEIAAIAAGVIRNDNPILAEYIARQWNSLLSCDWVEPKNGNMVPAMLRTRWNQSPYYNYFCPSGTPVGCVATAMAQIMKYWNHPVKGTGSHSYYTSYGMLSANFDSTYYDWDNMPYRITSTSSMTEVNAVGILSYHAGVAVEMNYNPSGSGAQVLSYYSSPSSRSAFVNYFGYKESQYGVYKRDYSDANWVQLLKDEINAGRPILYAGYDNSAGHAFVFDGYNSNGQFHVNWGWGGAYNGFFSIGALNPGGGGVGTNTSNTFNSSNLALIGIEPCARLGSNRSTVTFYQSGGTQDIAVTSNDGHSTSWSATSSASWLTLSAISGAGNGVTTNITLTAIPNTSDHDRVATIVIVQDSDTVVVTVQQLTCTAEDMCTLTINGYDRSGDGWEDGHLTLSSTDGVIFGTFEINDGSYAIQDFEVSPDTVIATWHQGRSDNECTFFIENSDGVVWLNHTAGMPLSNGQTFIIHNPCGTSGGLAPIRYSVSATVNDTAYGYVLGASDSLVFGSVHSLTAMAKPGYRFVSWNNGVTANPYTFVVVANGTVTARFANLGDDTLHYDNGNPMTTLGSGGDSTYWAIRFDGSQLVGRATLNQVKFFNMYSGNYTLSIYQGDRPAPMYLVSTARFYQGRQTRNSWVTQNLDPIITIDHSKPLWVVMGYTAGDTPAAAAVWCGNNDGSWFSSDGVHWTFEDINATWMMRTYMPIDKNMYTLTVSTNNRKWGTVTGGGMYRYGEAVVLTATPKEGYRFVSWNDGNTDNPRTFYVNGDRIINGVFADAEVGIDNVKEEDVSMYVNGRQLYLRGVEGHPVSIYDAMGRCVYHSDNQHDMSILLPSSGVYIVRYGEISLRRIVAL